MGGDSWNLLPFADLPELEGAFCVVHWHADQAAGHREIQRFISDYRQAYGRDPTDQAALAYDAMGLLLDAVTRGGDDVRYLPQVEAFDFVPGAMVSFFDFGIPFNAEYPTGTSSAEDRAAGLVIAMPDKGN